MPAASIVHLVWSGALTLLSNIIVTVTVAILMPPFSDMAICTNTLGVPTRSGPTYKET